MLKGMKFLITKSRGRVSGETKPTPPAPVILGRDTQYVPRIFLQQVTNLVNKVDDGCLRRGLNTISQTGRSMIEMLGVLAIIAVLSVGGIAGYSKAMEKFKFNKAIDEYSTLLFGVVQHLDDFKHIQIKDASFTPLGDIAVALEIVPPSWQKISGHGFIDGLGNLVQIFIRDTGRLAIDFYLGNVHNGVSAAFNIKLCREIVQNMAVPLHSSIVDVFWYGMNNKRLYGDAYCNRKAKNCLSQITLEEINNYCSSCGKNKPCAFVFDF